MTGPAGVPALDLPFASGRFVPEELVRERASEVRLHLEAAGLGRFVQDDETMADLICRTSPQATSATIGFAADWLLWVFPLDDLCEQVYAQNKIAGPADLLTATALPGIVRAGTTDFCTAAAKRMSPGWGTQFRRDLNSYLRHAARYAGTTAPESLPPLDVFLVLRREEGAAKPTVDLVEVTVGADLPEALRSSARWRRLSDACADVLTWTNDIYSFQKERQAGSRFNLIDVLVQHEHLPERDACARAVAMTNQMAQQFLAEAAGLARSPGFRALTADAQADVLRCVGGMEYWMRGQYEWFATTRPGRYRVLQPR